MLFANGRWSLALAAWIAPALLLRFLRTRRFAHAFAGGLLVLSIANFVWWQGVFPLSGLPFAVASIVLGFMTLLPYLIDRRFARRLRGLPATLVFPSAAVTIELLQAMYSPFGSWGSYAYSQAGNLPLIQLLSITGLAGVTFVVLWLGSILNQPTRANLIVYACVLAGAFTFGALRLRAPEATDTVRIAGVTPRLPTYTVRGDASNAAIHAALASVRRRHPIDDPAWERFRTRAAQIDDDLLATSANEARAGAKLVVWSEGAGIVELQDESAFLARAGEVARASALWIELSYLVLDRRGGATFQNKNVLVDAAGVEMWTYQKSHPVPGMEACVPGDGQVPVAPTPFGRVATVICYDADFPRLVAQAGAAGVDVLLIPADDWREIASIHSRIARFRAIEHGFSLVRSTSSGFSTAVDRHGRVRATQDFFAGARVLRADVPRRGSPTVYARVGDLAAYCSAALFVLLLLMPIVAAVRSKQATLVQESRA